MTLKRIIWVILALAVVGGFIAYKMYTKPHTEVNAMNADFQLSAAQLFQEYSENEDAANAKYLNKVIEVEGDISVINTLQSGSSFGLETGDPMGGVTCEFEAMDATNGLNTGQKVKVKGFCSGKLMDVVLVRCSIEKI